MHKPSVSLWIFVFAAVFSAAAIADVPSVYKWTDSQGVVHYSDKPPQEAAPDLQTLDLPAFPAQDPAKIAADQAALTASTAALQQQMLTQAALDLQAAQLAQQRAELQATEAALQQGPAPAADSGDQIALYPIYARSMFIPRAFRRNLYMNHHPAAGSPSSVDHPMLMRPALPVTHKP